MSRGRAGHPGTTKSRNSNSTTPLRTFYTGWAYRDVIDVVEQAGKFLDAIVLPKVTGPGDVTWLDLLLGQLETALGYPAGRIGIEAQIEDAAGLARVEEIAAASPRLEASRSRSRCCGRCQASRSRPASGCPCGSTGSPRSRSATTANRCRSG